MVLAVFGLASAGVAGEPPPPKYTPAERLATARPWSPLWTWH
jgi:hypothetical protein